MNRTVTRQGVTFQISVPDSGNPEWFYDVWSAATWEPDTLEAIDRYIIGKDDTFVDVGAWVGPMTLWAARHGAQVVAIEPDPVALQHLERNVVANGFARQVEIINAAVTEYSADDFKLHASPEGFGSSMTTVHRVCEHQHPTSVRGWALPTLLDLKGVKPALVKIDTEGSEATFLASVAPWAASQGIPLAVAMHEAWWPPGRRVDPEWFAGFAQVTGECSGFRHVLAEP
jgi:FkbM family methyltransferase